MSDTVKVVHHGRGGYVEYQGFQYTIDHVAEGCFCVHFPSGNSHKHLDVHLNVLRAFADNREPKWYVGTRGS